MASLALIRDSTTRYRHLHCHIAWDYPFGIISLIVLSWYLHQPESHQQSVLYVHFTLIFYKKIFNGDML